MLFYNPRAHKSPSAAQHISINQIQNSPVLLTTVSLNALRCTAPPPPFETSCTQRAQFNKMHLLLNNKT